MRLMVPMKLMDRKAASTSVWRDYLQATDKQIEAAEQKRQNEEKQKERLGRTRFAIQETRDNTGASQTDDASDPVC